ncbi:caspase family protein [Streptomyces sp. NPDC007905]|uniref:caspase family protein n=1 Tax=Streptomyces sp. NPDC007905 TaxID=3364788 RepID=UPI0036E98CDB
MALYALLVGIDGYRAPVAPLGGCRNDIDAASALLESRLPPEEFVPLRLTDGAATRAAVINGFRRHLGRAASGDSVLFWFSGHGSQAPVPARFAHLEPTGLLQTLICVDSRHDGVPDLYDKELAVLIGEVATRGAHVVAVLDCCHADSGTRGPVTPHGPGGPEGTLLTVRGQPALTSPPRAEFLLEALRAERGGRGMAPAGPSAAPHVLLAACHSDQYAVEVPTESGPRGLFSLALLEQLENLGPAATFRELMTGTRCRVEDGARGQVPVLSPAADAVVDRPFLGGGVRAARSPVTMRWLRGAWEVDAGACHGVPSGTPLDPTLFAVHDSDPPLEVRVLRVQTDRSEVEPVGWTPSPREQYSMVLTSVPLPVGTVALDGGPGDEGRVTTRLLAATLDTAGPAGGPSPHVRVADPAAQTRRLPDVRVHVPRPATVRITTADGSPIVPDARCATADEAARVVMDLEHIARWRRIKELHNPVSTLPGAVAVEIVAVGEGEAVDSGVRPPLRPGPDGAVHLDYRWGPNGWEEPEVFVRLRNTTDRQLYCVLLDLTDRFRIHPELFSGDWIAPWYTASAAWGRAVTMSLPPGRPVVPGATGTDWLKVLVAERLFSSEAFGLGRLGEPEARAVRRGPSGYQGVLDRLGLVALRRDAEVLRPEAADWTTGILPVVVRVPGN